MVDVSPGTVPPQPGTPATPAGGWRRQPPPWRPQPLRPPQRPAKRSEEAREGGRRRKKAGGLQRQTGELLLRPLGWSAAGSGQEGAGGRRTQEQRRRFPQGCGEEEAGLRSVGAGGGVPSPDTGRRQRGPAEAHPTISRLAVGCPQSPAATGPVLPDEQKRARGLRAADSSRHALAGTVPEEGGGGGGTRVRQGQADRPPPAGPEKSDAPQGQGHEKRRESEGAAAGPPAACAQQQLGGSAPHARQRGAARGAAEALTPPAPSAAAAARTGGARGRRRRSSPWRFPRTASFPENQSGYGAGSPSGVTGL